MCDKYEELAAAVRLHSTSRVLLKMVGPSKDEMKEAEARLELEKKLSARCEFGAPSPSRDALEARKQWKELMREQGDFEERYY